MVKKALVVEGGAMRGIFASGVLDSFLHHDYNPFDFVMGVSAGASNLVGYLAEQPERSFRVITELATSRQFFNPLRFMKGGDLVDVKWLIDESNRQYPFDKDKVFQRVPFYAAATNVETGRADYYRITAENHVKALEATAALPIAYKQTPCFSGECYTDGGVSDSIPVIEAYRRGARDITVILSHPLSYEMQSPKTTWLTKKLFARHPHIARSMLLRARNYNKSLDFIKHFPEDAVIRVIAPPENFAVKRLTMKKHMLEEGYEMGLKSGELHLSHRSMTLKK
ncbi:patatin-like phospholipase family protein [Vibrio aphrogenes]|uniref:patatin-like phospholipase family protein n=1 Tax=Vibrio aphrogenes TaxID=1891186 RepID=UPI000B354754|nr:patatin family protein [Vibrio aphrogenes]